MHISHAIEHLNIVCVIGSSKHWRLTEAVAGQANVRPHKNTTSGANRCSLYHPTVSIPYSLPLKKCTRDGSCIRTHAREVFHAATWHPAEPETVLRSLWQPVLRSCAQPNEGTSTVCTGHSGAQPMASDSPTFCCARFLWAPEAY